MASIHYLTVQDILWINLQISKKVHKFNYARLEEATFYQYAYGDSNSLGRQAYRFLTGFLEMQPIEAANEPTAFVAAMTFARINGHALAVSDASGAEWALSVGRRDVAEFEALLTPIPHFHASATPNVRAAVRRVLGEYPATVAKLLATVAV